MTPENTHHATEQPNGGAEHRAHTSAQWPEYQFHDPVWLTWWLESLYPLTPIQQAEVAIRLQSAVYAPAAQEVLSEFLDHLRIRFGVDMSSPSDDEEAEGSAAQSGNAWWEKVVERMIVSFKPVLWLSVFALGGWIISNAAG